MIRRLKNLYLRVTKAAFDATDPHKRSSKWGKLEKEFVTLHPQCAACGTKERLQAHHKKPFHLHPELELDPANLIVLCMSPGHECHLNLGHGDSWKCYNSNVEVDASELFNNAGKFDEIVKRARLNRLSQ